MLQTEHRAVRKKATTCIGKANVCMNKTSNWGGGDIIGEVILAYLIRNRWFARDKRMPTKLELSTEQNPQRAEGSRSMTTESEGG